MQIYYATTNPGKIESMNRDLSHLEQVQVVLVPMDIPEPRADETRDIAAVKVKESYKKLQAPVLAQDGGFYIPALNGFPKAYVHFALDTLGLEGILLLMENKEDRSCYFLDTLAYMAPDLDEPVFFDAKTHGTLSLAPRGELQKHNWGELHKIFIPKEQEKTFTEMTAKEMDAWSAKHRTDWCGAQFAKWLEAKM